MVRKIVNIGIFILSAFSIFAENIEFNLLYTGNLNGEYDKVAKIYSVIKDMEKKDPNLIKISGGDIVGDSKLRNEVFDRFIIESNFDFNFLGTKEYLRKLYLNSEMRYSTLNIGEVQERYRYSLLFKEGFKVAIIGITDLYGEKKDDIYDYDSELRKFIYKVEDKVDFIFLVSELRRNENIEIIKKHPKITVIFEAGYDRLDKTQIKINGSLIIPGDSIILTDFKYSKGVTVNNKKENIMGAKKLDIEKIDYYDSFASVVPNVEFQDFIKWQEEKRIAAEKEIIGYNEETFYKEDVLLGTRIGFVKDLGERLKKTYNTDVAAIPSRSIKGSLEKGFYNRTTIEELFSGVNIIVTKVTKATLEKLYKDSENNKGDPKYLIFVKPELEDKKDYTIVSTEHILADYTNTNFYSTETKGITLKEFLIEVSK